MYECLLTSEVPWFVVDILSNWYSTLFCTVRWNSRLPVKFLIGSVVRGWLGRRVVSMLDSGAEGPGFKSQPRRCRVTVRQTVRTHRASVHQAAKLVAALLRVARVTQAWQKVMADYRLVNDSRHLQADCQKPGSAPEPYTRQSSTGYLF